MDDKTIIDLLWSRSADSKLKGQFGNRVYKNVNMPIKMYFLPYTR